MQRGSVIAAVSSAVVAVALLGGCTAASSPPADDDTADAAPAEQVVAEDGELRLVEPHGAERVLTRLAPEDGDVVHASVRPGEHGSRTVLVLTRIVDGALASDEPVARAPVRYELRYLVVDDHEVTDLYWMPWRLQVDESLAAVLDVPPRPVWHPEGDAIAWLEWTADGTRLRTVGWRDDGDAANPSDDAEAYALEEVPPGTQLESWDQDGAGRPVLIGRGAQGTWQIVVEPGDGQVDVRALGDA